MHNQKSVLENETHKIIWNFKIQTDYQISVRHPYIMIVNRKKGRCRMLNFAVTADHRVKLKEIEKKDKYLTLLGSWKNCRTWKWRVYELKLMFLLRSPKDWYRDWRVWNSRDHPNDTIIKIGMDTEKSPGDLRRLAVTQTPVRNHRLTLIGKTLKIIRRYAYKKD